MLIAFGDTFGNCTISGQEWRNKVLSRSADRDLANGHDVPAPQYGNQFAGSPVPQNRRTSPGR